MRSLIRPGAVGAAILLLGALGAPGVHAKDSMELVIGNGPHAGTYRHEEGRGWIAMCGRFPGNPQLSAVFKDMNAVMKGAAPNQLLSMGFNVFNPDDAGAKKGGIVVLFGDGKGQTKYQVMVPEDSKGPLVMNRKGKALALSFDGKTRDGVKLQVKVDCVEE